MTTHVVNGYRTAGLDASLHTPSNPTTLTRSAVLKDVDGLHQRLNLPWPVAIALIDWLESADHEALLRLARLVVGCPTAVITTLLDADHAAQPDAMNGKSMLALAHRERQAVDVADAAEDTRFGDDLLVHAFPHARFFVGAPIHVKTQVVGTLFAIDYHPRRRPSEETMASFSALAHLCGQAVELGARRLAAPAERSQLDMMAERSHAAVLVVDHSGRIESANRAASMLLRERIDSLKTQTVESFVVGWQSLVGVVANHALAASRNGMETMAPLLVEIITREGTIIPARASITYEVGDGTPRYRLVVEELP